jgi:hypothetical protein
MRASSLRKKVLFFGGLAVLLVAAALYLRAGGPDRALAQHPEFSRFDPLMVEEQELLTDFEFFSELERVREGRP